MSNTTTITEVSTATVRAWFNDNRYGAGRVKRLTASDEKFGEKAAHTVVTRPNLRGRLHPLAVAMFNEAHAKKGIAYVSGATRRSLNEARALRDANRVAAAEKGIAVSDKGPLPNAAKEALGLTVEKAKGRKSGK